MSSRSPSAAKQRRTAPSKNPLVWGTLFVLIGAMLLLVGGWSAMQGFETNNWPRVAATIVDSKVSVTEDNNHDSRHTSRHDSLYLAVAYVYEVGGQQYTAGGLERGTFGAGNEYPVRKLWGTPYEGQKVTAAVNPSDPSEAYLVPGVSGLAYLIVGVGLTFFLIGLMMFATYRAARRRFVVKTGQAPR
jgi:hypothetical protein